MCFIGAETAAAWGMTQMGASLAVSSAAMSAVGMGMTALGQVQANESANAQAKYQSQMAANNAATLESEARYAEETAQKNAAQKRRETGVFIGKQRAAEGATGAVVDSGSFMDVSLDTAERGEMDALALLREGDMTAWRARVGATNSMAQSGLYAGSQKSALMPVAGGLLSGAGNIGANWYTMTKKT